MYATRNLRANDQAPKEIKSCFAFRAAQLCVSSVIGDFCVLSEKTVVSESRLESHVLSHFSSDRSASWTASLSPSSSSLARADRLRAVRMARIFVILAAVIGAASALMFSMPPTAASSVSSSSGSVLSAQYATHARA